MGFCYSSHTQTTHPCRKPSMKKTCEQPSPMGAIDVQTVLFPPYPFMINHSCQLQQLSKQHGNIQICGFIPTLHVDVRRPDSGRW